MLPSDQAQHLLGTSSFARRGVCAERDAESWSFGAGTVRKMSLAAKREREKERKSGGGGAGRRRQIMLIWRELLLLGDGSLRVRLGTDVDLSLSDLVPSLQLKNKG